MANMKWTRDIFLSHILCLDFLKTLLAFCLSTVASDSVFRVASDSVFRMCVCGGGACLFVSLVLFLFFFYLFCFILVCLLYLSACCLKKRERRHGVDESGRWGGFERRSGRENRDQSILYDKNISNKRKSWCAAASDDARGSARPSQISAALLTLTATGGMPAQGTYLLRLKLFPKTFSLKCSPIHCLYSVL